MLSESVGKGKQSWAFNYTPGVQFVVTLIQYVGAVDFRHMCPMPSLSISQDHLDRHWRLTIPGVSVKLSTHVQQSTRKSFWACIVISTLTPHLP